MDLWWGRIQNHWRLWTLWCQRRVNCWLWPDHRCSRSECGSVPFIGLLRRDAVMPWNRYWREKQAVHFHGFIMLILWNVKQYCGIKTTYTMYSHNTPYSYKERDLTKTLFFFLFFLHTAYLTWKKKPRRSLKLIQECSCHLCCFAFILHRSSKLPSTFWNVDKFLHENE